MNHTTEGSRAYRHHYDVIVVGGGHAGTEAALAAARSGAATLLLTHSIDTLGQLSCNPAIGGIGKGHLVREIDALGGAMAQAADRSGIHFRTLNARKGPAVRATRAQADRQLYRRAILSLLEAQPRLTLFQQGVDDLLLEDNQVAGVLTSLGVRFRSPTVVLTTGTFLAGLIHVGHTRQAAGRAGDPPASALAARLRELPLEIGRLKTGTPPRIDGRSIDFSQLEQQPGDEPRPVFSSLGNRGDHPRQVICHITQTNKRTHDIIRGALDRSPLFSGEIDGVGPRYCPSIEDKVVRFADRDSHQIFIEPEGLDTVEVYPNGISTSLPFDVQVEYVRSINGFARAHITRPGYAIEYDYIDPRGLRGSLENRAITGLFLAGQINGTTGYEEAAAQGLVAGINAARRVRDQPPWIPRRDEAYIGVLIDDLVTRGTREPYRMFTSRAEYRLSLREDNADMRLTETGRRLGLVEDRRWSAFCAKAEAVERLKDCLPDLWIRQATPEAAVLEANTGVTLTRDRRLSELVRMPELRLTELLGIANPDEERPADAVIEQVEIQAKYAGYLERQHVEIERQSAQADISLPDALVYAEVHGLSHEVRQKLEEFRPATIGQAARISGVTPAAVSLLLVYLKKQAWRESA